MEAVTIVGLISAYKEGRLVQGAIRSLVRVGLDGLCVFEGPAGDPLGDDVPDSDYDVRGTLGGLHDGRAFRDPHFGRWRTDARKRTEMLQYVKRDFPGSPLWGVILDGDEILHDAEYLRDMVQTVAWEDEQRGASIATPDNPPVARIPLRLVERDGSISIMHARVVRLDLIREYNASSSLVTNVSGVQEGWGNRLELSPLWVEGWAAALERGQLVCLPPFPCEPCIVHRAHLRHPLRRGLRMQDQETRELDRLRRQAAGS